MKNESSGPPSGGSGEEPFAPDTADREEPAPLETASHPANNPPINGNNVVMEAGEMPADNGSNLPGRIKTLLIGKPRDLADKAVFRHISLVAFLAWVGLGADGLSSTCYGPAEAFGALKESRFLAVPLALAIMGTVWIIASCYSHIIEEFPSGGGGYLVASKLLGKRIGVISGCALLVDYVLTITTSIASAGDAIFGLLNSQLPHLSLPTLKVPAEFLLIVVLIVLNLRGVKESVQVLLPIFIVFLITHVLVISGVIILNAGESAAKAQELHRQFSTGLNAPTLGWLGMLFLFLRAYSMGAGTYTGLEAVSNSMTVLREPRVATAKRTMRYMAISLSLVAGGLILGYLLLDVKYSQLPTMNQILTEKLLKEFGLGDSGTGVLFLSLTLLSAGALLIVGAQAGFIDGPRVLANMAQDSWVPRWFALLSERLVQHYGILLMGISALAALLVTRGNIQTLVTMYSINVFLTFSLSMLGMCRHWIQIRRENPLWRRRLALFSVGLVLCVSVLCVSVYEKFEYGGKITIGVTLTCVVLCYLINRYYVRVGLRLRRLDESLSSVTTTGEPIQTLPDPDQPAAVILVGDYSGLGIHTMLGAIRFAPGYFRSFIFISSGVIDSGVFKGSDMMESLERHIQEALDKYVDLARRLGMPAKSFMSLGTDAVDELEQICLEVVREFPKATFFAGQLVFQKDTWVSRLLHNQTAYSLQRRLQWAGYPMVILPTRVR
jgi:amino acid transporter